MASLVDMKQMHVETVLLQRDYYFSYVKKHHISVANNKEHMHDAYIVFTVAQRGDCKE